VAVKEQAVVAKLGFKSFKRFLTISLRRSRKVEGECALGDKEERRG
jgi:hypothetical protein